MNSFSPNKKILYVDDEANLLSSFRSLMRKEDVQLHLLEDSMKIEEMLRAEGPFSLVISDQKMPGMDGVSLLQKVTEIHPDTLKVLITGFSDQNDTIRAINFGGISRYISKPWDDNELKKIVKNSVVQYNLVNENQYLYNQIKLKNENLSELLNGTIGEISNLLKDMISVINPYAAAQIDRIKNKGLIVLGFYNQISLEEKWEILRSLELFNIGLALMPTWIQVSLNKEGLNAAKRFSICKNHYELAANLLSRIPKFSGVANILLHTNLLLNNERISTAIPLGAKILYILISMDNNTTVNYNNELMLKDMLKTPAKYDPEIIQILLKHKEIEKPFKTAAKIRTDELRTEMIVLQDVITKSGIKIIPINTRLTISSITALKQWIKLDEIIEPILVGYNNDEQVV